MEIVLPNATTSLSCFPFYVVHLLVKKDMDYDASIVVPQIKFVCFVCKRLWKDVICWKVTGVKVFAVNLLGMFAFGRYRLRFQWCGPLELMYYACTYCVFMETFGLCRHIMRLHRMYVISTMSP